MRNLNASCSRKPNTTQLMNTLREIEGGLNGDSNTYLLHHLSSLCRPPHLELRHAEPPKHLQLCNHPLHCRLCRSSQPPDSQNQNRQWNRKVPTSWNLNRYTKAAGSLRSPAATSRRTAADTSAECTTEDTYTEYTEQEKHDLHTQSTQSLRNT